MEKSKGLNLVDYFMLGFGSIVGVGWAVAVNGWFGSGGGPIPTLIAYAFATLMIIPIAFCYAELTSAMPVAGGVVAFAYKAFGSFSSFLGGWFVALAYITIIPWEAIYINDVMALIFPALKSGEPLYTVAGVGIYMQGIIVGVVLSFGLIVLNWRGVEVAGKAQTILSVILIGTGILVIICTIIKFDPSNLQPIYENIGKGTHTSILSGIVAVMAIAPFFLAGFDTIPQAAEEGNEGLSFGGLGKVLVMAILSAGVFYCLIILSTGMAISWKEFYGYQAPSVSILIKNLYPGPLGAALYWVVILGALAGLFTTWNGFYIASARLLLGMGRAGLLPPFFASLHPKFRTPRGANLFIAIACLIGPFVGMGVIEPLTVVGSTAFVIGWLITAISTIKLRFSQPDMLRPFKVPGGLPLVWIAVIISALIVVSTFLPFSPGFMGPLGIKIFIVWMVMGLIFYLGNSKYGQEFSEEERINSIFRKINA
jgi:APA family basic amino acid/polyamine antiporter